MFDRNNRFAFDKSVRSRDADGRLHVSSSHISKATVNPYRGDEIPDYEKLGLNPKKIYYLLRDPEELRKAAKTFNHIPILNEHIATDADSHKFNSVIGSTGTDASYNHPYLDNSLVFWPRSAIDDIEDGDAKELSSSYRYKADMTPGEFEGKRYDGVMRDIVGNHVALVSEGRAGSDVCVGDSALRLRGDFDMNLRYSPSSVLTRGALLSYIYPRLAQDQKIDLKPILKDVTAETFSIPKIAKAVKRAADGKLARDADLEDIEQVLAAVKGAIQDEEDDAEHEETENEDAATDEDEEDGDLEDMVHKFLAEHLSTEDQKTLNDMIDKHRNGASEDEEKDDETERDDKDEMTDEKHGEDEETDEEEDDDKDEEKDETDKAEDRSNRKHGVSLDAEEPDMKIKHDTDSLPVTKKAMDAAIRRAQDQAIANQRAIRDAERFVRPFVGDLSIAFDSADDVYRHVLEMRGIKTKGVHPSAYRVILENLPKGQNVKQNHRLAADSAAKNSFSERFPNAAKVVRI